MSNDQTPGLVPGFSPSDAAADADTSERLSADDMATRREAEFLAHALLRQRAAGAIRQGTPGRCTYCGERCVSAAVFCDPDCRAEWEAEQAILRRQGRAR